ncbi:hypothetical protein [Actinomycetospora sp.]|uniref:hypothetical protein n=1 Tax=Actinomycetospora sp. TaxID=1872135 RepID=UPI002F3FD0DF
MSERMTVSFVEQIARRVRARGVDTPGGASGYLERLVREDELREAARASASWFQAHPSYEADAAEESVGAWRDR